ncbi:MAG TPA: ABC transporter ATP-binding protein [Abditibacteriaceae bacterium]|nr:ABC transporter ATP-binding protein [Abditibacteriaceae bacterium]
MAQTGESTVTAESTTAAESTTVAESTVIAESTAAVPATGSGAGDAIIHSKGLTKIYRSAFARTGKTALQDLTFDVQRGEIFGLVGPNGSGKTTTLKLLLGLIKPTSGSVTIFGRGPRDVAVKQRIGFLPDGPYFYDHLNSYEILDFYGKLFGFSKEERMRRTPALLDTVGLNPDDRARVVRTYSKGMLQRVGLAQALINDPEVLFLDEPTTGLDPIGARAMKDAILQQRDQGKTVLLCSHLLADVQAICDRVAILSEGRLVKFGTVRELVGPSQRFEVYAEGVTEAALQSARQHSYAYEQENGHVRFLAASADQLDEILGFVRDARARTIDVKGYSETLEDVFVRSVRSDGR